MEHRLPNAGQQQPQACGCPDKTPKFICVDENCPNYYTKRFFCMNCAFNGEHKHLPIPPPEIGLDAVDEEVKKWEALLKLSNELVENAQYNDSIYGPVIRHLD